MKLTEIALQENRLTITLVLFVILGGLLAFFSLPRFEDPKIPFRFAFITTLYPGASVERMEKLVTAKIEEAISEVPEIEFSNSVTRRNASGVVVKIKDRYTDLQPIWDRLRRKLEGVKATLPDGVRGPFFNDEYGEVFGIIVTLAGENVPRKELKTAADRLHRELLRLEEVSKVIDLGEEEEQIVLQYDDSEMADAGLSPLHLKKFLEAQNVNAPGGGIREGDFRISVEPESELESLQTIEGLEVYIPEEEDTYSLDELLEIRRENRQPPNSLLRSSGLPAFALGISLRKGGNIKALGEEIRTAVASFKKSAPKGIQFDFAAFEPDRVRTRVNRFFFNLLESLVIVGIILMLTLGLRTGSIVAGMMPLVILATLAVMLGLNLDINLVALAAFVVVLGIMVDNHIVISERVLTLREGGQSPASAALAATRQLHAPLLTATATTIAGFLPIYLAKSTGGEYVTPLFLVLAIALVCSTFFAFTITPALSVRYFRIDPLKVKPILQKPLYRFYHRILCALLPRPVLVLAIVIIVFFGSVYSFRFIPKIFFPASDRPIFTLELEFPAGTRIEKTDQAAALVDAFIRDKLTAGKEGDAGILNWVSFIGRNAPRFILNHRTRQYSPEYAYFLFNLNPAGSIPEYSEKLENFCRTAFPKALVRARPIEAGPAVGFPIGIRLSGGNTDRLFEIADQIKKKMGSMKGLYNIIDNWGPKVKKYRVVIDDEKAGRAGITRGEIALALQTYLTGIPATDLRAKGKVTPILIKSSVEGGDAIEKIKKLHVYSNIRKNSVPLGEVANIQEVVEFANIIRRNGRRTVAVNADIRSGVNIREADRQIDAFLKQNREKWGNDLTIQEGGEGSESAKANQSILVKLPWAVFVIFLLLIRQMRSWRRSFIILCAVPMGVIGVVFGLFVTRQPFGFMTLIGMVSLTGIVVNNAIILIDRVRVNEEGGKLKPQDCIMEAAMNRLRPILLTSLTTIGGIFPLLLPGSNPTWEGMAIAIIFGLSFATVLVLVVVPILYTVLFGISFRNYHSDCL